MDLVDVARMRAALERTPSLVSRVFTDAEVADVSRSGDPAQRFAARFAAKEAVLKALGSGLGAAPLQCIEVLRADSGAPAIRLWGRAETLAADRGVGSLLVSMTHTHTSAGAVVVATGSSLVGGDVVGTRDRGVGD